MRLIHGVRFSQNWFHSWGLFRKPAFDQWKALQNPGNHSGNQYLATMALIAVVGQVRALVVANLSANLLPVRNQQCVLLLRTNGVRTRPGRHFTHSSMREDAA